MQNQNVINRVKLAAIFLVSALIFSYGPWQETGASASQEQPQNRVEIVGMNVPMNERIAADDGAALVIHFGGDVHGSLEPCG